MRKNEDAVQDESDRNGTRRIKATPLTPNKQSGVIVGIAQTEPATPAPPEGFWRLSSVPICSLLVIGGSVIIEGG